MAQRQWSRSLKHLPDRRIRRWRDAGIIDEAGVRLEESVDVLVIDELLRLHDRGDDGGREVRAVSTERCRAAIASPSDETGDNRHGARENAVHVDTAEQCVLRGHFVGPGRAESIVRDEHGRCVDRPGRTSRKRTGESDERRGQALPDGEDSIASVGRAADRVQLELTPQAVEHLVEMAGVRGALGCAGAETVEHLEVA